MNSRERFDFYTKAGINRTSDTDRIQTLINKLIDNLYKPTEDERCFITDRAKLEEHGMDGEPINWGDLKCFEVVRTDTGYIATIDEAAPDNCPELCAYIERYMSAWGWGNVVVETEW